MNKKRLGNDPLDDLDILKGPEKRDSKKTGKKTSHNAGDISSQKASHMTGNMTSHTAGGKASYIGGNMSGNMASQTAVKLNIAAKSKLRKMTYYFREDQLKELDKLSKKTGRDRSELARMAIDLLIDSVQIK